MANNGPSIKSEPGAAGSEAWDEERLEQALDELKLLHVKVCCPLAQVDTLDRNADLLQSFAAYERRYLE